MLHEVLLSLAGHPSPLLRSDPSAANADKHPAAGDATTASAVFTPPERELLASVSHLSGLHIKLRSHTAQIAVSHPSTICRAVAASISSVHLAAFQRKVLEVEDSVLRRDASLVGAYNIVPLTAVVGEFSDWTRRMEWLWEIVKFMLSGSTEIKAGKQRGTAEGATASLTASPCTGASIIDKLRGELQTGYLDIETTAASLVAVAETAWLKQVSAWILYGRLPTFGSGDFFVQRASEDSDEDFVCEHTLLPSFVTPSTASSMLFIGLSLNQIRAKRMDTSGLSLHDTHQLSSQLSELSKLQFPLDSAALSRTITGIRLFLSKNILLKFLPLVKVLEILQLLRDFFLLARGEFAMALSQQADEKLRSRWHKTYNLNHAYGKQDGLGNAMLKEGEVMQILSRTWAALGSLQGQHAEEDEGLELARDIMRLTLAKTRPSTPATSHATPAAAEYPYGIASTPFRNLLLSVPAVLTLHIPSPLDLFLSQSDLQTYTLINSYLLSIRRAHLRLTDLWKISALRRHWPPPPRPPRGIRGAGRARTQLLRTRHNERSHALRSAWANISAAIFFLAETEAYLQTEVVAGLWEGFQNWLLTGSDGVHQDDRKVGRHNRQPSLNSSAQDEMDVDAEEQQEDDIWLASASYENNVTAGDLPQRQPHDPQTLATAHRLCLRILARRILLVNQSFTDVLYELLVNVDHLVALVHRLDGVWTSVDLEVDSGVIDAFVDLEHEEADIRNEIVAVERRVRAGVEACIKELRDVEARHDGDGDVDDVALLELGEYVPRRVGGVDRLLMKLDFGTWFRSGRQDNQASDEDEEMEQ
ncbi:hypothetical protein PoMZ_01164 [Pyricularia oryzae]|uniref:Spindle pole body component n=1 Tax=Pyricularia oryzae TaxID=318829 RepID=A0A4P7N1J9_PYROR|nr:hypothetical protein PoMZ_01164 [Pyricularia oryzae]